MKRLKVTNPLVWFGALAIGLVGCADDVIIPPDPPPPDVPAEISIGAVVDFFTGAEFTTNVVFGRIGVFINFDTGTFEAAQLDLLVDGESFACQTFSGQGAVGVSSDVQTVVCSLDTGAGEGLCTGQVQRGLFDNGPHTIGAELTLQNGQSVSVTRNDPLIFANSNALVTVFTGASAGVVGNGERYFGGEDLTFATCPVIFDSSINVGEIAICGETTGDSGNNMGSGDINLGNGPGAFSDLVSEPFTYTALQFDTGAGDGNDMLVEDRPTAFGHDIGFSGCIQVFDPDGVDITSLFDVNGLDDFFVDFTGPMPGFNPPGVFTGVTEVFVDGIMVPLVAGVPPFGSAPNVNNLPFYREVAPIDVVDVSDGGVGFVRDGIQIDIHDANLGDGPACPAQPLVLADVFTVGELAQDDVFSYCGVVIELVDLLGNLKPGDLVNPSTSFGADFEVPNITNPQPDPAEVPVFNPICANPLNGCFPPPAGADNTLMFDALDPTLPGGGLASLLNDDFCGGGGPCDPISATITVAPTPGQVGGTFLVNDAGTDELVDPDFTVDLLLPGAVGPPGPPIGVANGGLDGNYTIQVFVPDNTITVANSNTFDFSFFLDTESPVIQPFTDFPPGVVQSNANALQFNLAGSLSDTNLEMATAGIFLDAGPNCDAADLTPVPIGNGPGEVDQQSFDITATAANFAVSWIVQNTENAVDVVNYCFVVDAEDSAEFKDGTDNPNRAQEFTRSTVTWNP